jgi:hypothetical protein
MPMIATTMSNSISVNPVWRRARFILALFSGTKTWCVTPAAATQTLL